MRGKKKLWPGPGYESVCNLRTKVRKANAADVLERRRKFFRPFCGESRKAESPSQSFSAAMTAAAEAACILLAEGKKCRTGTGRKKGGQT